MIIRDEIMDLWIDEDGDIRGTSKDFDLSVSKDGNNMFIETKFFYKGYEYSFFAKAYNVKKIEN